ncbi:MAG: hemerythrin domain-containing protein [Acidobacteria bacterium]|nr:hemerythrin domain-containing protein [Acidobacteriota bacterium]
MSRPTHLLRHEHRVIHQAMHALEGMCLRMRAGGSVPDKELTNMLDFIRIFADGFHHGKEERHLFPVLEKIGIKNEDGPLAFLRGEHKKERNLLSELTRAVGEYRRDPAAREKFVSVALQFKDRLIGHMQKEDAILFRLAEEMMDDHVKDSLNRALAVWNKETQELTQRYEKMANELEKTWSV